MNTTDNRYVVEGTDVRDLEQGRRARFVHAEAAQLGADWLNGTDATPDDYEWVYDLMVGEAFELAEKMQALLKSEGWEVPVPNLMIPLGKATPIMTEVVK